MAGTKVVTLKHITYVNIVKPSGLSCSSDGAVELSRSLVDSEHVTLGEMASSSAPAAVARRFVREKLRISNYDHARIRSRHFDITIESSEGILPWVPAG